MATITGLTAARMLAIEAASIVAAALSGDHLILTKHDGTPIDVGNVRGAKGDKGDRGDAGTPGTSGIVGELTLWPGRSLPAGMVVANGQRLSGTTYPLAYALAQTEVGLGNPLWTFRTSDTTFTVPNFNDKFLQGSGATNVGATGGESIHTLTVGEIPSHDHGGRTGASDRDLTHTHYGPQDNGSYATTGTGDGAGYVAPGGGYNKWTQTGRNVQAIDHLHGITAQGGGVGHNNLPPFVTVAYLIRVA